MNKTLTDNKKPLLLVALVVVLFAAYFYRDKWLYLIIKPKTEDKQQPNTATPTNTTATQTNETILKRGSSGSKVKELQILLNAHHRAKRPQLMAYLVEDGAFGAKTEAMLFKWTAKKSISITQLIKDLK